MTTFHMSDLKSAVLSEIRLRHVGDQDCPLDTVSGRVRECPHERSDDMEHIAANDAMEGLRRLAVSPAHDDSPDNELAHIQADGFYGPEKGFHDVEQLRRNSNRLN